MLQLNVSQASTICRASGRAMRSLGIWLRQSAFCKLKKTFLFLEPEKKITAARCLGLATNGIKIMKKKKPQKKTS